MTKLTLYRKNGSCAFVPHSLLLHLNIPATTIQLKAGPDGFYEAADGSFSNAEYRRTVNPLGYVPVLKVEDEIITELPAIVTYIASLVPGGNLLGRTILENARVVEWLALLSGLHSLGFAGYWRPYRFSNDKAGYEAISAKGMSEIVKTFEIIEGKLRGRAFPVGNALTVVDFNLYIFSRWGQEIGIDMKERFPNYSALARRMEGVKGVKKAIAAEGLGYLYP